MQENWSLDNIYKSIDCQEFKNDFENYQNLLSELNQWAENNLGNFKNAEEKIEYYINKKNELLMFNKLLLFVNLSLSADTTNEKLLKMMDRLQSISAKNTIHEVKFKKFLSSDSINLDEIFNKNDLINEHKFLLKEMKEFSSHTLSPDSENMASELKTTGSVLWQKLWEQLTSTVKVDIIENGEEKQISLSMARNLAYSNSAEVRKNAYFAELKAYEKIDKACAFALNGIKGEVITLSKLRNYPSVLEMTALQSRLDIKIIKAMFSAMEKYLPKMREYFKKKAELLNHKNGLPFYDLFAPIGKSEMQFTYDEAKNFIVDNFSDFSQKLGQFAKKVFDENWIDVYPRDGKVGGAFCEAIHSIKESRILTNFTGSFNDVVTIAHEIGHAYHDSCLYDESELNAFYPMPIAETASTLCETIVTESALKTVSKNDALVILESDISSIAQIVVDIFSRFIFEDEVFKKRENGTLSVNELNQIMLDAQDKTYGDGLDKSYRHPYMWVCKPHYYDADFNYYNFPYAFGLLFSKGLYAKYLKEGDKFVENYDKLLANSSKNMLSDVALFADINIYEEDFWSSALDLISNEIDKFYVICDEEFC